MQFRLLISLAMLLALGACGGTPGVDSGSDSPREKVAPAGDAGESAESPATVQDDIPAAVREAYSQALFLLETGDQAGAEAQFLRFASRYPNYAGPHVNLAIIYIAQGKDDEADTALNKALAINPDYAPALNQLGILHRKNGRFADAEAAYMKAVTVHPDYALAHLNLGILNDLYLGRLEQALSSYQAYQSLTPEEDSEVARWIVDLTRRTGGQ